MTVAELIVALSDADPNKEVWVLGLYGASTDQIEVVEGPEEVDLVTDLMTG